ncbi:MAG TPA: hypothetical protein VNX27_08630 [Chthoniobacterales bacterium]|nr:hypothetical protein [Chthoniobacterales bacterium]
MKMPMKRDRTLRKWLAVILGTTGALLLTLSFQPARPPIKTGLQLALKKLNFDQPRAADKNKGPLPDGTPNPNVSLPLNAPTFGHPVISGIGGFGYEENLRLDPTDPTRIYTSVPGSVAADTSWIWRSLDTGKTFKWVPSATPLQGKAAICFGGGDTELGVDSGGHLYFNDLPFANFSVARSDDHGVTFTCNNTGVPDAAVDRQWYAIDGDPTAGGNLYLTNDEVGPGGVMCGNGIGGTAGNNVLVMYRSPINGIGATAGLAFGPANHITPIASCDEGIMGNDEISQMATPTGQPNGLGGFATLPLPVKHIYVIHDNLALNQIRIGRCFPVAFGAPVANVSDPSGLNCTDLLVKDLGPSARTGGNFPTMAIDKPGNLYVVWEQAPTDANSNVIGDTVLMYSYSTNEGNTWSTPIQIDTSGSPDGVLHNNVFAWIAAGDDGRVNIAWYGTTGLSNPNDPTCGQTALVPPAPPSRNINGPDATTGAFWSLWLVQSLNAHDATPTFTAPVRASSHHNHIGTIQTLLGGQCGDRQDLGDFLQLRTGAQGEAEISYADSNSITHSLASHAMFVRQSSGTGLIAGSSPVNIAGLTPFNGVSDPSGDAKYQVLGTSNEVNMPQLDILASSVSQVTTAPCSVAAPCYKIFMQLNNLSLAPTLAQDPDIDLVWLTQWFVPSTSDAKGGRDFHVYAESTNGGALQCFTGQNAVFTAAGAGLATMSYPGGLTALPAANCQSTLGVNGTIIIYVPLSMVSEPGAIDNRLHEVTASTMTLTQPANTSPDLAGSGIAGSPFNLIDVAQGYTFDPDLVSAVSRKTHGTAGTFDIDLMPPAAGIEDRSGGPNGDFQIVVTFATSIANFNSATVSGTGSVSTAVASGNQIFVNLTGVTNAQRLSVNLLGVNNGTKTADYSVPLGVLLGDVNGNGVVSNGDVSLVQAQVAQTVTSSNFREDVNANGILSNGDVSITQAQVGQTLP